MGCSHNRGGDDSIFSLTRVFVCINAQSFESVAIHPGPGVHLKAVKVWQASLKQYIRRRSKPKSISSEEFKGANLADGMRTDDGDLCTTVIRESPPLVYKAISINDAKPLLYVPLIGTILE